MTAAKLLIKELQDEMEETSRKQEKVGNKSEKNHLPESYEMNSRGTEALKNRKNRKINLMKK